MSTNNTNIQLNKKVSTKNHTGFTLIELIVVVTILAILGAIGFVTMTGYFAGARDSARLSDMNSIYTQLNLTAGMDGSLPYPDNYRALSMSGTAPSNIIIYQGYAAKNVLGTIKFEKGGRDPKDDVYYTYTTDKKRKQAQLMGYFEEYDTSKLSNVIKLIPQANAATVTDYSDRTIGTLGKNIGTLLESITFVPVQQTSTGILDIAASSTGYVAYFDSTTTGSGAGTDLKTVYVSKSVIYNSGSNNTINNAIITPIVYVYSGCTIYNIGDRYSYSGSIIEVTGTGVGKVISYSDGSSNKAPTGVSGGYCNSEDIAIWNCTNTPMFWTACNMGTSVSGTGTESYGGLYQWGNNTDIQSAPISYTIPNTSSYSWSNPYSVSSLINPGSNNWTSNMNLWGITTGTNLSRQGPCPVGYHIPTGGSSTSTTEFGKLYSLANSIIPSGACGSESSAYKKLACVLRIPKSGYMPPGGTRSYQGQYSSLWSSSNYPGYSTIYELRIDQYGSWDPAYSSCNSDGSSVRCLKN